MRAGVARTHRPRIGSWLTLMGCAQLAGEVSSRLKESLRLSPPNNLSPPLYPPLTCAVTRVSRADLDILGELTLRSA